MRSDRIQREESFLESLEAGSQKMKLSLDAQVVERCRVHWRMLEKWADRINLTTVREPAEAAEKLFLDSAILVPYLNPDDKFHDVGSGAGFPGLVVKAFLPGLHVTLTEARRKKVSFLKQAARAMDLNQKLDVRWLRVGWDEEAIGTWNEVASRATFPPIEWLKTGPPLVAPGGRLWIFSGQPHGEGDLGEASSEHWLEENKPEGFELESVLPYGLPLSGLERTLVSFRKKEGT
jgi:16S rRNA (guanine527-N7)-methyltransferase